MKTVKVKAVSSPTLLLKSKVMYTGTHASTIMYSSLQLWTVPLNQLLTSSNAHEHPSNPNWQINLPMRGGERRE